MSHEDAFCKACLDGKVEEALAVMPELRIAWRDPHSGWSLLHVAVEHGHPILVRRLVEAGADIEAENRDGVTPLGLAVDADIDQAMQEGLPCHLIMTRLLLELGADPVGGSGTTPIQTATNYRHEEAVALLTGTSS